MRDSGNIVNENIAHSKSREVFCCRGILTSSGSLQWHKVSHIVTQKHISCS